jgi:hypothetical protein
MFRLLTWLVTISFGCSCLPSAAQSTAKRVSLTHKPAVVARPILTPLRWAAQQRQTVPATANFYGEVIYFDAADQPITDSLLALTDTKRMQYVRRDKVTRAPVGTVRQFFWPSLRPAAEGQLSVLEDQEVPVGPWTYWYDHTPSATNKRQQVVYDPQGQPVAGTNQQWVELKPGCRYILEPALPTATSKLTCQFCTGTSRAVFAVDLPADALGIVLKFDIRDEAEGLVSFQNAAGIAAAFTVGGPTAALGACARAWNSTGPAPGVSTKCTYFLTTDGAAA